MRARTIMSSLAMLLAVASLVSSFESTQANPSFSSNQPGSDYRIEVRLDHVRGLLILEMQDAPFLSRNFIELQTSPLSSSTPNFNPDISYIPVYPDADGYLRVEIPMPASLSETDFRITAFAIDAFGILQRSHFWTLQRRRFNNVGDATSLYPGIDKVIEEESRASLSSLHPYSAMSLQYYATGESHLYVSDTGLGFGTAALNSSGALYSAAPSLGLRLSVGPAGVFTAN